MAKIQGVESRQAPQAVGPYSQGTTVGDFVFVSGQLPLDPATGQMVERNIQTQTAQALTNIEAVLRAANLTLGQVVRCEVFLKDLADFKGMNEIYGTRFTQDVKPARQVIEAARLPLDAMVEISCIAHRG
jgi:2-iminobutanoate/2-iminopropanoate deaminase